MLCILPGSICAETDDLFYDGTPVLEPVPEVEEADASFDFELEQYAEPGQDIEQSTDQSKVMADGSILVTISATGDVTIGGDTRKKAKSLFDKELANNDGDLSFPFKNVRSIFEADDLTLVNFEGTLTTTKSATKNSFSFAAPPEYVEVLTSSSVEAVSLENNHVTDHGDKGYTETCETLADAGIVYSGHLGSGTYTTDTGIKIGMLSYQTFNGKYPVIYENMPLDIAKLREEGCQLVVVSYHWGEEKDYVPNERQVPLGRATVDAGADLVIGHHSHRINPIEYYNGKYICYSLGNFSFAGNSRPDDMDMYIFQQQFLISPEGDVEDAGIRIIPGSISSQTKTNDFTPTPFTDQEVIKELTEKLVNLGAKAKKPTIEYALTVYPVEAFETR